MDKKNCCMFNATFHDSDTLNAAFQDNDTMNADFGEVQEVTTTDYNKLSNKPSINEVELKGNKTFEDLGDKTLTNIEIKSIFDRVFRVGGN